MNESIHKLINWEEYSKQQLTEDQIRCYCDYVDWESICQYQQLSESFIEKYADRVNWNLISLFQSLSEPFIEKYKDQINWYSISYKQKLSEPFIEKYKDRVDWYAISHKQKLSEPFIEKYRHWVNWLHICCYQQLSEPFIEKYIQLMEWGWIEKNQTLSNSFKERIYTIKKSKLSYSISCLPHYPLNRKHLQVDIDLPCVISKGHDPYWFKYGQTSCITRPQYWYVNFKPLFNNLHSKGFTTEQKAVDWAIKQYSIYLKSELNRIGI